VTVFARAQNLPPWHTARDQSDTASRCISIMMTQTPTTWSFDTLTYEGANAFMAGPAFARNPIGEDFDPDDLIRRYEAGEAVDDLVFRSDQPQHCERKITRHHPELVLCRSSGECRRRPIPGQLMPISA
jgi:hypothetical protein